MTESHQTAPSYALTRFNALNHGVLSRNVVLPWEDASEYRDLVTALVAEHVPVGPTEEHLVEELAGVIWRKRRLRRAEAAAHRSALRSALASYGDTADAAVAHLGRTAKGESVSEAVSASADEVGDTIAEVDTIQAAAEQALRLLEDASPAGYDSALDLLPEETKEWWAECLDPASSARDGKKRRYTATPDSLLRFVQTELIPWLKKYRTQLENQPLIREQALGEAGDAPALDRLYRYEVHLDRKLERMLAMLFKLKELRRSGHEEI